jgi:hypothetical protein
MGEQQPSTGSTGSTPQDDASTADAAYLPIGLVFLTLGLTGLVSDSMRYASFAFLPVGVTFLVLALRSRGTGEAEPSAAPAPGEPGETGPDVTPR